MSQKNKEIRENKKTSPTKVIGQSFDDFENSEEIHLTGGEPAKLIPQNAEEEPETIEAIKEKITELHINAKDYGKTLNDKETEVANLYDELTTLNENINYSNTRKSQLEKNITTKETTLRAAHSDLELVKRNYNRNNEKINKLTENIETSTQNLNQKRDELNLACAIWQEEFDKIKALEDKIARIELQQEEERLAEEKRLEDERMAKILAENQNAIDIAIDNGPTPQEILATKKEKRGCGFFFTFFTLILFAVIMSLAITTFFFQITHISGSSMEPTISNNDKVITNKIYYEFNEPTYGDVILISNTENGVESIYIKRIIALGGDTIKIENGLVYLNGELLEEDYLEGHITTGKLELTVPEGEVFFMGDNREVSKDSRTESISTLPVENILGIVNFRLTPIEDFGSIE